MNNKRMTRLIALLATTLVVFGSGCAATRPKEGAEPPQRTLESVGFQGSSIITDVSDPWEGWNRRVYNFNARFDRYIFAPTAEAYKRYLPKLLRMGVHNFMRNIREVMNVGNALLQFRLRTAARSTGRFVVNSTLGVAGLGDPATLMGMYYQREDFGQTLGVWGAGPGPFIVLPLLGPSSLRDTFGLGVDYVAWTELNIAGYGSWARSQFLFWPTLLYAVDTRANIDFRYYELGTIYEYIWVRKLYLEVREFEIKR